MPANLTPQYLEAEARFRQARTPEEKLAALKEMMALIPKHKGTEKMRADLKRRWSKLNDQLQRQKKKKGGAGAAAFDHIEREGAGQIALVGLPNSGKSSLVDRLTNAQPEVADYHFSTLKPVVGMMPFEDVQIQLVDLPPVSAEYTEGWVYSLIRNADLAAVLVDLTAGDPKGLWQETQALLEGAKLRLVGCKRPEGLRWGPGTGVQRALVVGTKSDQVDDRAIQRFCSAFEGYPVAVTSTRRPEGLEAFRRAAFESLEVVRVYSKEPGRPPEKGEPFILKRGSTVLDLARQIHRDFERRMKYARVWGSGRFAGQQVPRDHVVQDGDVVEVHV